MALTNAQIVQQYYIAYYGRPADTAGLTHWTDLLAIGVPVQEMINFFGSPTNPEFVAVYGANPTPEAFIEAAYNNIYNRGPDTEGAAHWLATYNNLIAAGATPESARATLVIAIVEGVAGAALWDQATFNNKMILAEETTALASELSEEDAAALINFVRDGAFKDPEINKPSVLEQAQQDLQDQFDVLAGNDPNPGQTFMLTVNQDAAPAFTGTAGDDTYNAAPVNLVGTDANTLQAFDSLDGGDGTDTFNIFVKSISGTGPAFNANQVGTIANIEIINIFNTEALGVVFAESGGVDASKFGGAEQIWQIDGHTNVINLGAATTAGFRNTEGNITVAAAAGVTTLSIALDNAGTDDSSGSLTIDVSGAALTTATIDGTIISTREEPVDDPFISLDVHAGLNVETFVLNTSIDTVIDDFDNSGSSTASTKTLSALNAAGSTGNIEFDATSLTGVKSITTGTGDDKVTLATAFTASVKTATAVTGDGDDTLTIHTTNSTPITGTKVVVDAGAGNDEIVLKAGVSASGLDVMAGDGDDTVEVQFTNGLADIDGITMAIDGGNDFDTIKVAGRTLTNGDYTIFSDVITNFEAVEFTGTVAAVVDASRMAAYDDFTFAGNKGDTITKVAANDVLTTKGDLTAVAAGYTAATETAAAVYAGSLDITATGAEGNITASAETLTLEVKAQPNDLDTSTSGSAANAILKGDLKTATITLTNAVSVDEAGEITEDHLASVTVTTIAADPEATEPVLANLMALTSLTLKGDGSATVSNIEGAKLATVNAAELGGVYQVADSTATPAIAAGDPIAGLDYTTTNNSIKETITLGSGVDKVTIGEDPATVSPKGFASTAKGSTTGFTAMDTITGFTLVESATTPGEIGATSDTLVLDVTITDTTFAKATVSQTATLGVVLNTLALDTTNDSFVFEYQGHTYIYSDIDEGATADTLTDNDLLVKLTGTYDLDLLLEAITVTV